MVAKFLILLIQIYQKALSPFMPACCRYSPSCSEYVKTHIQKYGALQSIIPCIKRIFSCHPFSKKQIWDPVK